LPPKPPRSVLPLALALAALTAASAGATIRWVPSLVYPTIQSAIDESTTSDSVGVYPGTYAEALTIMGKDITLMGVPTDDTPVVITTNNSARIITIGAGVTTLVVSNLHLVDGNATRGGAIEIPTGISLQIHGCFLVSNSAHEVGGASLGGALNFDAGSRGEIENCNFYGNSALAPITEAGYASGGAIQAGDQCLITVRRTFFDQNFAQGFEGGPGGAVALNHANGVFDGCRFDRNGGAEGGAIYSQLGDLSVQDCRFQSNSTGYGPAAIYWQGLPDDGLKLLRSVFNDNFGAAGGSTVFAEGYLASEISGNTFAFNQGNGPALEFSFHGTDAFRISNNIVAYNQSVGIECYGTGTLACNDVWNNASGNYGPNCPDPTGTSGNISADPVFCDGANRDLRLRSTSPCSPTASDCGLIGALPVGCTPSGGVGPQTFTGVAFLAPIAPNPPRGTVHFSIDVARSAQLTLSIVDATGRVRATVADDWFEPGRYARTWLGGGIEPPGVYWALLRGPGVRQTRSFLIVR
jgi:hypothetical protein